MEQNIRSANLSRLELSQTNRGGTATSHDRKGVFLSAMHRLPNGRGSYWTRYEWTRTALAAVPRLQGGLCGLQV